MTDNIVELENGNKYVLLDGKKINDNKYYLGLRLTEEEEPTDHYLFFAEENIDNTTYLTPLVDEESKGMLLTLFTANFINMVYDI